MNEEQEELDEIARLADMHQAWLEYEAEKARRMKLIEQMECPHDEHDHGICLDCGKDIMDDLIERAEYMREDG